MTKKLKDYHRDYSKSVNRKMTENVHQCADNFYGAQSQEKLFLLYRTHVNNFGQAYNGQDSGSVERQKMNQLGCAQLASI